MNRLLILYCIIGVLSGCTQIRPINRIFDTTTEPFYIDGVVTNLNERYYIASGVSFVPPHFTVLNTPTVIYSDAVRFGFYYREYGAYGSVLVSSSVATRETPKPPKDKAFVARKHEVDKENARRAGILAGTLEEHWQFEKEKRTIREMVQNMEVRKEGKLVRVIPSFDKSEWEAIAKDHFLYFFSRKRTRLEGLSKNTYQETTLKGWDCLQVDTYDRLGVHLGQYTERTDGGIEHYRGYGCYVRPDFTIWVIIRMDSAPDIELDYGRILAPLLASIEVDETLPADYTTLFLRTGGIAAPN